MSRSSLTEQGDIAQNCSSNDREGVIWRKKNIRMLEKCLKKCEISLTCPSPTHLSLDWEQTMLACLSWVQGRATETTNYNFDDHWSLIRRISIFTWVMRPSLWMLWWWTSSARVGNLDSAVTKYWKKFTILIKFLRSDIARGQIIIRGNCDISQTPGWQAGTVFIFIITSEEAYQRMSRQDRSLFMLLNNIH